MNESAQEELKRRQDVAEQLFQMSEEQLNSYEAEQVLKSERLEAEYVLAFDIETKDGLSFQLTEINWNIGTVRSVKAQRGF